MKKLKLLVMVTVALLMQSCFKPNTIVSIKNLPAIENSFVVDLPRERVWEKVVDYFADNSIPIGVIEKESGLITSKETIFPTTVEGKDGKLVDPNAHILVERMSNFKEDGTGLRALSNWNIRIKETNGKTEIKINVGEVITEAYMVTQTTYGMPTAYGWIKYPLKGASTGNFEKMIYTYIID